MKCEGLFLSSQSVPLVYMSVLMSTPHCFDYYKFVLCFEIGKHEPSNFVLLFKIVFGYLGFLDILYKFYDRFFHFWKKKHQNTVDLSLLIKKNQCHLSMVERKSAWN